MFITGALAVARAINRFAMVRIKEARLTRNRLPWKKRSELHYVTANKLAIHRFATERIQNYSQVYMLQLTALGCVRWGLPANRHAGVVHP